MKEHIPVQRIWKWFAAVCVASIIALFISFSYEKAPDIKPAYVNVFADPPPKFQLGEQKKEGIVEEIPLSLDYKTYLKKGDEFVKYGEYDQAVVQYLKANRLSPLKTDAFLRIGDAYLKKGNFELAKENYVRAMEMSSKNDDPRLALAHYYIQDRNFDAAKKILKTISDNREAEYYQGLIETIKNNHEAAKKKLEEATKDDKENEIKKKALDVLQAYQSFSYTREGSDLYLDMLLAQKFNKNKDYAFALEKSLSILRAKPDYRDAWLIAGHTYLNLGKFREAHISLSRALSYDTEKPEILFLLALAYQGIGDYKSAIDNFLSAFRKGYKNTTELSERLAEVYFQAEDYENSLKHYETVIADGETDVGYYIRPVWICIEKTKNKTRALELAMRAFQKFPSEAMSYNLLGWASIENDMLESSKKYLEQAIRMDPELDAAYLNLGYYYENKNDKEKAKELFKKAYNIAKENYNPSIANIAKTRYEGIIN